MKDSQPYEPDWISEADAMQWIGVSKVTLFRWRTTLGLHWTNLNGKNPMYDRRQLKEILNKNSTYAFSGQKLSA